MLEMLAGTVISTSLYCTWLKVYSYTTALTAYNVVKLSIVLGFVSLVY